jgi:hypothetical protein
MFEDFRKQADEAAFPDPDPDPNDLSDGILIDQRKQRFLGMTAIQRLAIAILLLFMTCVLGTLFLLVTERVIPPIFG